METKVFAKLLEIQKKIKALKKDAQSYGFEYVSGNKIIDAVRPLMDEYGLLLLPEVTSLTSTPVTYTAYDKNAKSLVNKTENLVTIHVNFTWVDVESGETYTAQWQGTGQNGYDKGFGSALTYAERYYLLKLFHIATDKDDVDALAKERDEAIETAAAKVAETMPPLTAPTAKPLCASLEDLKNDAEFWQWIDAAAQGRPSKQGKPAREAFINKFRPTPEQLQYFDGAVETRKAILNS